MLGKILLPFKTKMALKSNNAIRISEGYLKAEKIAVIYTFVNEENRALINKLLDRIELDGKQIQQLVYITNPKKEETFNFPNFTSREMDFFGNFKNEVLEEIVNTPFDYLLNLDIQPNQVIENVLANSKAKCRVGKCNENKHEFYELMIDAKEDSYEEFLVQIYHYMKNVR